jgi:biopolymer transport protein TolR
MVRQRPRQELRAIATIDMTPLVDLTFLLLIVFMITAPVLENSVDVSPPELSAARVEPKPHKLFSLDRQGHLKVDGADLTPETLAGWLAGQPFAHDLQIFLRADAARPYGEVMQVMRTLQEQGFNHVSLVTVAPQD